MYKFQLEKKDKLKKQAHKTLASLPGIQEQNFKFGISKIQKNSILIYTILIANFVIFIRKQVLFFPLFIWSHSLSFFGT